MINIIKSDIYKTLKSKYFWVISITLFAFRLLNSYVSFHYLNETFEQTGFCTNKFFLNLSYVPSGVFLYVCIFTIISICFEFSSGSIKNIASKGFKRETFYLAKFICAMLVFVFFIVICSVIEFILAQIMIGNKIPEFYSMASDFAYNFSLGTLQTIAHISVAMMLSFLLRSSGFSMAIFYTFATMQPIFETLVGFFFKSVFDIQFSIQPYLLFSAVSFGPEYLLRTLIVLAAYIFIPFAIGIYTFKKRDI